MLNNGLNLGVLIVDASAALTKKPWRPGHSAPDPVPASSAADLPIPSFRPNVNFSVDPVPARSA